MLWIVRTINPFLLTRWGNNCIKYSCLKYNINWRKTELSFQHPQKLNRELLNFFFFFLRYHCNYRRIVVLLKNSEGDIYKRVFRSQWTFITLILSTIRNSRRIPRHIWSMSFQRTSSRHIHLAHNSYSTLPSSINLKRQRERERESRCTERLLPDQIFPTSINNSFPSRFFFSSRNIPRQKSAKGDLTLTSKNNELCYARVSRISLATRRETSSSS